jgi:hypothetical protein
MNDIMWLTKLFRLCRPQHSDMYVYDVDVGTPEDYNFVLYAAKVENGVFVGDTVEVIIAKEWVSDTLQLIKAGKL